MSTAYKKLKTPNNNVVLEHLKKSFYFANIIIIRTYINSFSIIINFIIIIEKLKNLFKKKFNIKDFGFVKIIIG